MSSSEWASEAVAAWERRAPEVLDLAAAVSLASRVEPVLLRRARLELCPWVHAGAEAELWHSSLVQAQSPKALELAPAVAHLLQRRLLTPGHRPGLDEAWHFLFEAHLAAPEIVLLEEEVTWRALRNPGDPQIQTLLQKAVRSLLDEERPELAEWALRALRRFPAGVELTPEALSLRLAAGVRLGGLDVFSGEQIPDHLPKDDLFWIAAQSAARVPVHLAWAGGELLLSLTVPDESASTESLPVPRSNPVLLEAIPDGGEPLLLTLRPDALEPVRLPLKRGGLRLRTAAGEIYRVEVAPELPKGINALVVLDRRTAVSASADGLLRLWDLESGQVLRTFGGDAGAVQAMAALDHRRVVCGSPDGLLRVCDVETGQALRILEGHRGKVSAVAAADSRRIVSGASDGMLRVWDVESGQILQTLAGRSGEISALAVLNTWVIASSVDGVLRAWDLETGQMTRVLEGHSGRVNALAILDRRRIVSASADRTLRLWDLDSLETLWIFSLDLPPEALSVTPDRATIVVGDAAGRIHFLDVVDPRRA